MKSIFARHGIPETVTSDDGHNRSLCTVCTGMCFNHTTSSPNHLQGNREAERGVQTTKNLLKKEDDLYLAYRASARDVTTTPLRHFGAQLAKQQREECKDEMVICAVVGCSK